MWRGYLDFYRAAVDATTTETTFARLTGGVEPMGGFLARGGDGAAIGLVHWIVHRSCWTVGDYCYLQDLFVAAGRRGDGVGRLLIDAVAAKARALGCSRVHWLTHETNRRRHAALRQSRRALGLRSVSDSARLRPVSR